MKFWVLFQLSLLADFLWYHSSRERENSALLLPGGNRSPGSPLGLHWLSLPQDGGAAHYCWVGVGILAPHWAFTDTSLTGRGGSGSLWLSTWLALMLWQRMVLLLVDGGESPDSPLCLLLHHLHRKGEGCFVTTRWGWMYAPLVWFPLLGPSSDKCPSSILRCLWCYTGQEDGRRLGALLNSLARVEVYAPFPAFAAMGGVRLQLGFFL